jgi:uncharacterized protein YdeI (YjbR/CyaY-like superfamily)
MTLTRARLKMPDYIRDALTGRRLMDTYHERPDYQQNDYIGWITRARRDATRDQRLAQMLEELEGGKLYMNMVAKSQTLFKRASRSN